MSWFGNLWDDFKEAASDVLKVLDRVYITYDSEGNFTLEIGDPAVVRQLTYSDPYNQYGWTRYTNLLDTQGRIIGQVGRYDNGNSWEAEFSNGVRTKIEMGDHGVEDSWETTITKYDTAGRKDAYSIEYYNLTEEVTDYDQASVKTWETAKTTFDRYDRRDKIELDYDTGLGRIVDYDQSSAFQWDTTVTAYDGLLVTQSELAADGSGGIAFGATAADKFVLRATGGELSLVAASALAVSDSGVWNSIAGSSLRFLSTGTVVNATGTNTCEVEIEAAAASFRQRYSKLCATPLLRAMAEMLTPGTEASSTIRCFSAGLQIRRAATTAKSREDISPDLGTCLSPTMTNDVIISPVRHNPARRSSPGAYPAIELLTLYPVSVA